MEFSTPFCATEDALVTCLQNVACEPLRGAASFHEWARAPCPPPLPFPPARCLSCALSSVSLYGKRSRGRNKRCQEEAGWRVVPTRLGCQALMDGHHVIVTHNLPSCPEPRGPLYPLSISACWIPSPRGLSEIQTPGPAAAYTCNLHLRPLVLHRQPHRFNNQEPGFCLLP